MNDHNPLNPYDEALLKKALEQSANGQVVHRGSFAQYAQTPLNPDALEAAKDSFDHAMGLDTNDRYQPWEEVAPSKYRDVGVEPAVSTYLNASQQVVTSVEELDSLPPQSIVARIGNAPGARNIPLILVWQRGSVDNGGSDWCMPDTKGQITSSDVFYFLTVNGLRQELAVLYRPEVAL